MRAIEDERVRQKIAGFESRRGPLEGLKEIAADPGLSRRVAQAGRWESRGSPSRSRATADADFHRDSTRCRGVLSGARGRASQCALAAVEPGPSGGAGPERERLQVRVLPQADPVSPAILTPMVQLMNDRSASEILSSHVAMGENEWAFLPCLRREGVPEGKVAELEACAFGQLQKESRLRELSNAPCCTMPVSPGP